MIALAAPSYQTRNRLPDEFHFEREDRYISIGYSARNRIFFAVQTVYQKTAEILIIRIISSRKATPTERKFYEED